MSLVGSLLEEAGGLLPIMLRPDPPLFWSNPRVTLGGCGDSFYEYLLKQWLMSNRTDERFRSWYRCAVRGIKSAFVGRSSPSNRTFLREVSSVKDLHEYWKQSEGTGCSMINMPKWQPMESLGTQTANQFVLMVQIEDDDLIDEIPPATIEAPSTLEDTPSAMDEASSSLDEAHSNAKKRDEEGALAPDQSENWVPETCSESAVDDVFMQSDQQSQPDHGVCPAGDARAQRLAERRGMLAMLRQQMTFLSYFMKTDNIVFIVIKAMPIADLCATAERLYSGRFDTLKGKVDFFSPTIPVERLGRAVLERLASAAADQLSGHCQAWGYFKMDHLACFVPSVLALGAATGAAEDPEADLALAAELTEACAHMWLDTPTGLAPEAVSWNVVEGRRSDFQIQQESAYSILRPETVESLWYMYQITGDSKYQEWGWRIFKAIERFGRVEGGGYCGLEDVTLAEKPWVRDRMETFVLSETFKYLYLLFDGGAPPGGFDFRHVVLNTEGHPLPVLGSSRAA